jgi:hypothetical protein
MDLAPLRTQSTGESTGGIKMRRGSFFWGAILVLVGVVFLLDNLGFLDSLGLSLWNLLWPILLILIGLWFLGGTLFGRREPSSEALAIPLEGASRARIRIGHGAGRLAVSAGAGSGNLLKGTFFGGVDYGTDRDGDTLNVHLRVPAENFTFPFAWGPRFGYEWSVRLSPDLPLALDLNTGANDARIDLLDLRVTDLHLQTGASSSDLTMPANAGYTRAEIESGAASINVMIPASAAARIRAKGGLSDIHVDQGRFHRQGDFFQSPDYETASNKIELFIETGVGSVKVR